MDIGDDYIELPGVVHRLIVSEAGSGWPLMVDIQSPKGDASALMTQEDVDALAAFLDRYRTKGGE
ncbi:hypothetical protein [Aeromicrobium sp. 179-A 4D2 NHS]|uniref:hypothetical protein n=1 Tax=Aeromicrobium sp. 179-A 4D2 NHS TaxID=3142375 RepID=UPI0039A0BCEF